MLTKYIQRFLYAYNKVMSLPDFPNKIARGVALGTALDFLPMPFVSIPVSYLLARLLKVNSFAAVMTVILLKWAVPFFFAFDYFIGNLLLGEAAPAPLDQAICLTSPGAWVEWVKHLGYPFLLGSAVNSVVACIISYFVVKSLLDCRRKKRGSGVLKMSHPK